MPLEPTAVNDDELDLALKIIDLMEALKASVDGKSTAAANPKRASKRQKSPPKEKARSRRKS